MESGKGPIPVFQNVVLLLCLLACVYLTKAGVTPGVAVKVSYLMLCLLLHFFSG